MDRARLFAEERRHGSIAPEHLLFILLDEEKQPGQRVSRKRAFPLLQRQLRLLQGFNWLLKSVLDLGRRPVASRGLRDLIERSFEEMEYAAPRRVEPIDFMRAICQHNEAIAKELRAAGITRDTLTMAQSKSDSTRKTGQRGKSKHSGHISWSKRLGVTRAIYPRPHRACAHRGSYAGGGTR